MGKLKILPRHVPYISDPIVNNIQWLDSYLCMEMTPMDKSSVCGRGGACASSASSGSHGSEGRSE
ncbi:hypothetical protein PROFUN_00015 [Planoprotostelium fungivorum]|uniref:Uncharacterized protein n=1 Tax=Planoprotostelium fungivorum TaxID=1890364 RepID=A0A2P6P0D4_9EUKA|nr:hypothetical protein PROFUN_00015 [Planoprotostelium fungivorum]